MPLLQRDHLDALGAQPQSGAGHIHRDVAAADDDDPALDFGLAARRAGLPEEIDALQNARLVLSFHAQQAAHGDAGRDEHRVIVFTQLAQGGVFADPAVVDETHALTPDKLDLVIEHLLGQPVFRDAVAEHAARRRL